MQGGGRETRARGKWGGSGLLTLRGTGAQGFRPRGNAGAWGFSAMAVPSFSPAGGTRAQGFS